MLRAEGNKDPKRLRMIDERFSTGESFVHGLDPRVKIIGATIFSSVVALLSDFSALLCALAVAVILMFLARLPIGKVFYQLLLVNGLVFFLWLWLPFTVEGNSLFSVGPLVGTKQGVWYASQITLKSNTILLAMIALLVATPISTLGHAMTQLYIPDKVVHLFLFTYRYVHVIFQEYQRIINAMRIRGFVPRTNMHTYRSYAYLLGILLVRSFDRAERIHNAMVCRGFTGRFHNITRFSVKSRDLFFLSGMLILITLLILLQWKMKI